MRGWFAETAGAAAGERRIIAKRIAPLPRAALRPVCTATARANDLIQRKGRRLPSLILFNKPFGVVCQFSPAGARPTLKDYVSETAVYPAGRLDADSEGLVVLTADGALQHAIADPRMKHPKIYCAQVEGVANDDAIAKLEAGVRLAGYTTAPAIARAIEEPPWLWARVPPIRFRRAIPTSWIELTLTEGKNRQVRRMTAAVGLPTLRLVRYSIGTWTLADLEPGASRKIEIDTPRVGGGNPHPGGGARCTRRPR